MKKKYFSMIFLSLIFLACLISSEQSIKVMKNIFHSGDNGEEKKSIIVVIDAGHGGRDPGKVGMNGSLEKDINLSIAFKLKSLLDQNDIKVIMTRETDMGLYSESDSNKKRADMNHRIDLIRSSEADFAVSIHQNSYPEEYVKGAQVFYHAQSDKGKRMAEIIQEQLKETINDGNHRKAKSNENYYMLKNTDCPLVIVECGYLSNYTEASLLQQDAYQEKMAWGIHLGIMRFINELGKDYFSE